MRIDDLLEKIEAVGVAKVAVRDSLEHQMGEREKALDAACMAFDNALMTYMMERFPILTIPPFA